jgi:hypothetical protein
MFTIFAVSQHTGLDMEDVKCAAWYCSRPAEVSEL